jgi:hypothetical protein
MFLCLDALVRVSQNVELRVNKGIQRTWMDNAFSFHKEKFVS